MTLCGRMKLKKIHKREREILDALGNEKLTEKELRKKIGRHSAMFNTLYILRDKQRIKKENHTYYTQINLRKINDLNLEIILYEKKKKERKNQRSSNRNNIWNRSKAKKYLTYALEYIKNNYYYSSKKIAQHYLQEHSELTVTQTVTRIIGGFLGMIYRENNIDPHITKKTCKSSKNIIKGIERFLNGEKISYQKQIYGKRDSLKNLKFKCINKNEFKLLCRHELKNRVYFLDGNKPDYHFKQLYEEVIDND